MRGVSVVLAALVARLPSSSSLLTSRFAAAPVQLRRRLTPLTAVAESPYGGYTGPRTPLEEEGSAECAHR